MLFRRLLNYLNDPITSDPDIGDVPIFDGLRFVARPGGAGLPGTRAFVTNADNPGALDVFAGVGHLDMQYLDGTKPNNLGSDLSIITTAGQGGIEILTAGVYYVELWDSLSFSGSSAWARVGLEVEYGTDFAGPVCFNDMIWSEIGTLVKASGIEYFPANTPLQVKTFCDPLYSLQENTGPASMKVIRIS